MHFEILVEDQSGKKALNTLVPKIIGGAHTSRVISYKGVGRIPKDMRDAKDPSRRILLENLPRLLKGYGRAYASCEAGYPVTIVLVCDLDTRCLRSFRRDLLAILNACNPKPKTRFCFAVEEGEAWLLGDLNAVKKAYPRAKDGVLHSYVNDSICGTWEKMADALYPGGSKGLAKRGWQAAGAEKSKWAEQITPHMDVMNNKSASFCYFRSKLLESAGAATCS